MKDPNCMTIIMSILLCFLSLFSLPILGLGLGLAPAPSPTITPQNLTKSLHIAVNAAMNEALIALHHIKLQQPKSTAAGERAALISDCSEFYELSVSHLNQTLDPSLSSTSFDVHIWLSAALTNLDNCITSMSELNATRPGFLHDTASELISSSLAINAELMKGAPAAPRRRRGGDHDLQYRWFPDEGFMDSLRFKNRVNVVVAQDGSGDYRTIKEGLDASRRSGGKVVIHIKKGIYNEILEISRDMKNLVLIGDGIGKTIITGDRSAKSGFSTRESGTVSK